jgi:hypothetical protein
MTLFSTRDDQRIQQAPVESAEHLHSGQTLHKQEFVSMNAGRLAVGTLFIIVASMTLTLAVAQEMAVPSEAPVRQSVPSERRVFFLAEQGEGANDVRADNPFQRALNATFPCSNSTAATADQQTSLEPAIANVQEDGFDGCWRPSCINPCPCVYGLVEALFFMRNPRIAQQPIVVDALSNTTVLSTSDLTPNFNPGLRVLFGVRLFGGRALEFEYFTLFSGTTTAVATNSDPAVFLIFPGNLAGNVFLDMSSLQATYTSALQSFAVNLPCCCGCCDECCDECGCSVTRCQSFSWFGGFRYINLAERLNLTAQRTVSGAVEQGTYNIRTANNLFGAQLGARVRRTQGRFGWEATGFSGIFLNNAQQSQTVTDFPNFPLRPTVSSSRDGAAFVGGANLTGLYLLNNVWNIRAGYSVLWIEGLALAPDQLDFNFAMSPSGNQLHNGGGLLLHGINVGLEARW